MWESVCDGTPDCIAFQDDEAQCGNYKHINWSPCLYPSIRDRDELRPYHSREFIGYSVPKICLYPIKDRDRLRPYHSREFIGCGVAKICPRIYPIIG